MKLNIISLIVVDVNLFMAALMLNFEKSEFSRAFRCAYRPKKWDGSSEKPLKCAYRPGIWDSSSVNC